MSDTHSSQLNLFDRTELDITYKCKRAMRLAIAGSHFSRTEIADMMTAVCVDEGVKERVAKTTVDNWTKDSARDRMPQVSLMTIFCAATKNVGPIEEMVRPLGYQVIGPEDRRILVWAKAELAKKAAARKARLAFESLEVK